MRRARLVWMLAHDMGGNIVCIGYEVADRDDRHLGEAVSDLARSAATSCAMSGVGTYSDVHGTNATSENLLLTTSRRRFVHHSDKGI